MDALVRLNLWLDRHLTRAAKLILLANCSVFLAFWFLAAFGLRDTHNQLVYILGDRPELWYRLWQYFTYMFVHVEIFHLAFNMLIVWFFAPGLEMRWGTQRFWAFYLFCGVGGAVLHAVLSFIPIEIFTRERIGPVIGASGALFGVMLAYAAYWPDQTVLLWGLVPVKMRYLIPGIVVLEFFFLGRGDSGISNMMHLTGLGTAYFYLTRYHHTADITRWRYMR